MKMGQIYKLRERIPTSPFKYIFVCEGCIHDKWYEQKLVINYRKIERPLQLVRLDLKGPMQTTSLDDNKYFISFIDDFEH